MPDSITLPTSDASAPADSSSRLNARYNPRAVAVASDLGIAADSRCQVCRHQRRAELDAGLSAGVSVVGMAKKFDVPAHALRNHKRLHLSPTASIGAISSVSSRLQRFETVVDRILSEAETLQAAPLNAASQERLERLISRCTPALGLVARINGDMLATGDKLVQAEEAMRMGADAKHLAPEEIARRAQAYLLAHNDADPEHALYVMPKQERASTGTPPSG